MSKKYFSLVLIVALSHMMLLMTPTSVYGQAEKDKRLTTKAKADVAAFGIGPDARVSVKLREGKKLNGYISQAGEDSFVITDSKTGSTKPDTKTSKQPRPQSSLMRSVGSP